MARRRPAGVRQLPSGRWQARPTIDGKAVSLGTFDTSRAAAEAIEDARSDNRSGRFVSPTDGKVELGDYASDWLEARLSIADGTRRSYLVTIRQLGWLGDITLVDLAPTHVRRRIAEWSETNAPSTVRLRHTHLKTVLEAAVTEQRLVRNPAAHPSIELPRGGNVKARRYLTFDEVDAVAAELAEVYADLTWTLAWSGFRFHEAVGLTRADVDLRAGRFLLSRQWDPRTRAHVPLKGREDESEVRQTPIASDLRPVLERRLGPGFVFPSLVAPDRPVALNAYADALTRACAKAGVERFSPHSLRHSCASWLHAVGVSIEEASVWLGHRNSAITASVYTHLWPRQMDAAAEKLAGIRSVDLGAGVTRLRKDA